MSNLGAYQVMTTVAKKVGGPIPLAFLTALSGYGILRSSEAGIKKVVKMVKRQSEESAIGAKTIFSVVADGKNNGDLELRTGDKYRVLESDGEAVLIEKLGDDNNPYFVSADFLRSISDYE